VISKIYYETINNDKLKIRPKERRRTQKCFLGTLLMFDMFSVQGSAHVKAVFCFSPDIL
jgi:hypothetical protein